MLHIAPQEGLGERKEPEKIHAQGLGPEILHL